MTLDEEYFAGVAPFGTPDYYALLFCPPDKRKDVRTLLALERLLSQIPAQSAEPPVLQARLGWWAAEIKRLSDGMPVHPVAVAVNEILAQHGQSSAPLLSLFQALVRETSEDLPGTPEALLEHAGSRGAVIPLIAATLGAGSSRSRQWLAVWEEIGRARFVAMVLGARQPAGSGHKHFPGADTLVARLAARQKTQLDRAVTQIPPPRRSGFTPLLVMAALLRARLESMSEGKLTERAAHFSSLMRAWRCARRTSRGKLPFRTD